jgi:hypothetical protein
MTRSAVTWDEELGVGLRKRESEQSSFMAIGNNVAKADAICEGEPCR